MTGLQAYQKLSALCARSEHCQQDMLDKMRQWGIDENEQAEVMARLLKERFVDDERFTRAFVNDKVHYAKWGRRKIEQALWMKRIDEQLARSVLDDVPDEDFVAILRPALKQKRRSTKAASEYEMTMKLIKFALSRGFTMDIIRQCMEVDDETDFSD